MEHELNDIDRLTIELLGKRNNYPNMTDSVMSQEVIDEHLSDINDIFSNLLKGSYETYNDIKSSFKYFAKFCLSVSVEVIKSPDDDLDIM